MTSQRAAKMDEPQKLDIDVKKIMSVFAREN